MSRTEKCGKPSRGGRKKVLRIFPAWVVFLVALAAVLGGAGHFGAMLLRAENQRRAHRVSVALLPKHMEHNLVRRLKVVQELARDSQVIDVLTGTGRPDNDRIRLVLNTANKVARSELIIVLDRKGTVRSSTDFNGGTFTGYNYVFRPYFQESMAGKTFVFPALGAISKTCGVYLSSPVYEKADPEPVGVIALKIGISEIVAILEEGGDRVALVSPEGIIFSSNQSGWLFKTLYPLSPSTLDRLRATRQFGRDSFPRLPWKLDGESVSIDGQSYHIAKARLPIEGWRIMSLQVNNADAPLPFLHTFLLVTALSVTGGLACLVFFLFTNIQRRKRTEEMLRRAEEKYHSIFANSTMGIYQSTLDGHYIEVSPSMAQMLGYDGPEDMRETIYDIRHQVYAIPEHRDEFMRIVRRKTTPVNGFVTQFVRKDKQKIWVSLTGRLVEAPEKGSAFLEGFCDDITEKVNSEKEARYRQQQLIQADKMISLGILTSGVAHEINNPNTFIRSNAELLAHAWKDAQTILEEYYRENGDFLLGGVPYITFRGRGPILCQRIIEGSSRIAAIVKELGNFSRQNGKGLTEQVDLDEVIRSACVLLCNMIAKSTRCFDVRLAGNLPAVRGNFQRLEQVVINVIQNACQALPDPDRAILLETRWMGRKNQVSVKCSDRGIGIPDEAIGHVTDPFFTTKRDRGGTGLGLSISSNIVREHNGTMDIHSRQNEGTVVELRFPCLESNMENESEGSKRLKGNSL